MGNCASNPKTNEGEVPVPVPEPVTEEVKVEQRENKAEPKTEETPLASDEKSLGTLLNEVSVSIYIYILLFLLLPIAWQ